VSGQCQGYASNSLLPRLHGGHVIVTSRLNGVELFQLELLCQEAAAEFLLERTKNHRVNDASDCEKARELVKELDGPPLGLELILVRI
jgi:hypothetical protein